MEVRILQEKLVAEEKLLQEKKKLLLQQKQANIAKWRSI